MTMSRLRLLLRTSTFRLALLYMALFGGSVLVLLCFIYFTTAGYVAGQTDDAIFAEISSLAERYRERGLDGLATTIAQRAARNPRGHAVYLLLDPAGRRIAGNLDRWPQDIGREPSWIEFLIQDPDSPRGETYRARARQIELTGGFRLLVGQDVQEQERLRALTIEALAWGLALTLALGFIGGILMSRTTLQRIEAINRTSRGIVGGDMRSRIPTRGTGDEFDRLAQNLNAMLDQIETLMAGIRQVSDNIAHDLRSPLTRLRSRLELARMHEAAPQTRAMLDGLVDEVDGLLSTFNALLRIAEIESGNRRAGFAPVELEDLARDAVELYEPVAQEKGQTIASNLAPGLAVLGDRHLLSQAVANLLDNAIKHSPAGSRIEVTTAPGKAGPALVVADNGPGIPADQRDKVVQRFFRLEASRSTPGSGLGLSLAAAVAKLHGARLDLEDNDPGLRVALSFDRQPERPHAGKAAAECLYNGAKTQERSGEQYG
jgi:signal transduction histidine kinase